MNEVLRLINEMSPFLLLGFFFAGLLHAFVPGAVYSRYLSGHNFRSVLYAALLGVPLPLCSCGVLPTAMSLRKQGASKGATVSFLIATPETGVDSIAATYSLMGLPFALTRPIVAFLTSLFAGVLVNRGDGEIENSKLKIENHDVDEADHCCCHTPTNSPQGGVIGRADALRLPEQEYSSSPSLQAKPTSWSGGRSGRGLNVQSSIFNKLKEALRYGFIDMMGDIGKWLVIGLIVAGLITVFVPNEFFAVFKDNTLLSMLLVLAIAIPMYICATGSIPIAVALIMKGLTPGAALVLLMAGPACNVASMLVIGKRLGRKTLALYLFAIITGAVVAGNIIDLMPREWFMPTIMQSACCSPEDTSWFNWLCTGVLALLLLYSLIRHLRGEDECCCCHTPSNSPQGGEEEPQAEGSCCCHHHEEEPQAEGSSCCHHHEEDKSQTESSCCCHKD